MQASKTRENKSIDDESDDDDDEKFYLYPDTWYKFSAVFKDRNEKCFHVKEESVHTVLIGSSHQGDLSC